MEQRIDPKTEHDRDRRVMKLVLSAGQTLLENGAEVFRVEQTMQIMARSFALQEFQVYVLTNGIFASAGTKEIGEVRNIPNHTVDLGRVDEINTLSRRIAAGGVTLEQAEQEVERIRQLPLTSQKTRCLASGMGAFCFALMFGGAVIDGLVAAAAAVVLQQYLIWSSGRGVPGIFQKMTGSALIAGICLVVCTLLHGSADYATIGALMLLTPGLAFTMGIRDFANSDYLSGSIRMMDALLVGGSIASGAGLVMALYSHWAGVLL